MTKDLQYASQGPRVARKGMALGKQISEWGIKGDQHHLTFCQEMMTSRAR